MRAGETPRINISFFRSIMRISQSKRDKMMYKAISPDKLRGQQGTEQLYEAEHLYEGLLYYWSRTKQSPSTENFMAITHLSWSIFNLIYLVQSNFIKIGISGPCSSWFEIMIFILILWTNASFHRIQYKVIFLHIQFCLNTICMHELKNMSLIKLNSSFNHLYNLYIFSTPFWHAHLNGIRMDGAVSIGWFIKKIFVRLWELGIFYQFTRLPALYGQYRHHPWNNI